MSLLRGALILVAMLAASCGGGAPGVVNLNAGFFVTLESHPLHDRVLGEGRALPRVRSCDREWTVDGTVVETPFNDGIRIRSGGRETAALVRPRTRSVGFSRAASRTCAAATSRARTDSGASATTVHRTSCDASNRRPERRDCALVPLHEGHLNALVTSRELEDGIGT